MKTRLATESTTTSSRATVAGTKSAEAIVAAAAASPTPLLQATDASQHTLRW